MDDGCPPERVVSLDELRREVAARVEAAGGPVRSPEDWTPRALRLAARLRAELLADGGGYLADATHLRRSERVGAPAGRRAGRACPRSRCCCRTCRSRSCASATPCARATTGCPTTCWRCSRTGAALLSADLLREEGFVVSEAYGSTPR